MLNSPHHWKINYVSNIMSSKGNILCFKYENRPQVQTLETKLKFSLISNCNQNVQNLLSFIAKISLFNGIITK